MYIVPADRPGDIAKIRAHPDYRNAVPTPDHFMPLLFLAGLAAATGTPTNVLRQGYAYGSLSMTAHTLGAGALPQPSSAAEAAPLPDPSVVPAFDTNM